MATATPGSRPPSPFPPVADPGEGSTFTTDDPEVAQQFLIDAYLDNEMRFGGARAEFRLRSTRRDFGPFQIDEGEMDGRSSFAYAPVEQVFVSLVRRGTLRLTGRQVADLSVGAGGLALSGAPGISTGAEVEDIESQVVTVRAEAIAAAASPDPGAAAAPVTFDALEPVSVAHARMWMHTVDAIARLLDDAHVRGAGLILGRTERLLAAVTLATFPNGAPAGPRGGEARDPGPETLRLAIAFIEAEPNRDIAVADIARAAHVTARSVQHAFRRHLGTTPMAYLRRVRLDHIHQQLRAADPGDGTTVSRVALDWGFANPSRFARYYRDAYGQPPSKTLAE
jgi:AraC-like DNA-binding protein